MARERLSIIMNILGFGKGGTKKFKVAAHEPEGWPDEHSFVAFEHPSYANLNTANDIIEGILGYHGFDAKSHPTQDKNLKLPHPRKRKPKLLKKWLRLKMTKMMQTTTVLPAMRRKVCQYLVPAGQSAGSVRSPLMRS